MTCNDLATLMEWLILLQMAAMSFFCRHVLVRMQADLEQERQALQTRLKAALQLHMLPRNSILPLSPLDETVTTLDMLLEVGVSLHLPSPRWCLRHAAACTWVVWPAYVCFSGSASVGHVLRLCPIVLGLGECDV